MNKPMGIAMLAVGILLILFGMNASDSIGSDFSRFFTGAPTDKAIWLLLVGVLSVVVGLTGSLRRSH
ncbi:MAG: rane protein [Pedosphaera sp.]|nr:rane protein [Pedosphaera sp.]